MRFSHFIGFVSSFAGMVGCGGEAVAPVTPASAPSSTGTGDSSKSQPVPAGAASEDDDPKPPDPNESATSIVMAPEFTKEKPAKFPAATVSDHDCWQGMELSGNAKRDFDALVTRCGTPTGMVEYVHPATGHLHHKHDQRDTYKVKLLKGYCFRYFAVADSTIDDLDILVERYGGDMVGDDQVKGPVAIIKNNEPWCMDDDVEYDFDVLVDGKGQGDYVIGVWTRPKGAGR
jgi:hypothetical protein